MQRRRRGRNRSDCAPRDRRRAILLLRPPPVQSSPVQAQLPPRARVPRLLFAGRRERERLGDCSPFHVAALLTLDRPHCRLPATCSLQSPVEWRPADTRADMRAGTRATEHRIASLRFPCRCRATKSSAPASSLTRRRPYKNHRSQPTAAAASLPPPARLEIAAVLLAPCCALCACAHGAVGRRELPAGCCQEPTAPRSPPCCCTLPGRYDPIHIPIYIYIYIHHATPSRRPTTATSPAPAVRVGPSSTRRRSSLCL